MSVRLPSSADYAPQVEKEQEWLPILAEKLSFPIPIPIAKGNANGEYPWSWSIYKWLEGEPLSHNNIENLNHIAKDLG
jgi:aminoglycoside phosphotransferase (APT) family kinase protein